MSDINKLAETLVNLKIIEVNDLAKILKEKYGLDSSSDSSSTMPSSFKEGIVDKSKEKSSFDVVLKGYGNTKLPVIKRIKDVIGLGLKEAKELVDNAPKSLKKGISKDEAELLKKQLEEVGAEIELI